MTRAAASILGTGGRAITVRLYGQDSDLLQAKAAEVARILEGIDGLVDSAVKTPPKQPSMVLDVDLAAAAVAEIRPGDVRHAAATFLEGTEVGGLFQDHEVSDVPVRGTPATWDSVSAVQNLLLNRPDGGQPRLDDVRIPFPLENRAEVFGEHAARRADLLGVPAATGTAVLGVFLLLQGAFASWRLAPAFVALPTALAGAVCALTVRRTLERGSVAGMLLVFGLATPARLLLIRHCRHLRDVEALSAARVERAAHERQRPVLVTAVVAGATFPPLPFLGDAPVWGSLRRWP